jgi:hypothetical protein
LGVLAVVACAGLLTTGAGAQQQAPPNGLYFVGEAGPLGKRSLFEIMTSRGSLRTVSISIVEGARVPALSATDARPVGLLNLDTVRSALVLTLPRRHSGRSIMLLQRGNLRVRFAPRSKDGVLRLSGLPAKTTRIDISLNGGTEQLLTSQGCYVEQNFEARATRVGAASPVHTVAGVTC